MNNFSYTFLLFLIYSILGWLMEVTLKLITEKKFINRGFLIGPYCPIYGVGSILVIFLLKEYINKPVVLFILSITICSIIEYSTSFILEKLFNTSWWDYRSKKFNINGRICLETMVPFGIGCLLLMKVINPFITKYLNMLSIKSINIIAIILLIIIIIDFIISTSIIIKFREIVENAKDDNTEKVTKYVKKQLIKKGKALYIRLISAFPNIKIKR